MTGRKAAAALVFLLVVVAAGAWVGLREGERPAPAGSGEAQILEAFERRASDLWVEAEGAVIRLLADDEVGSRHQRFILRLASGHTLLVSHNIDIAPRVQGLSKGEWVSFRGEYEWNAKGGVIHWTHRDPAGRVAGGWIEVKGRRYE